MAHPEPCFSVICPSPIGILKMPTVTERVSVLETKVDNVDSKLDDIKTDLKDVHDCVHRTGEELKLHIEKLNQASLAQHNALAYKISELEKFKNKWTYMVLGGLAVAGWVSGHINTLANIVK